MKKIHLILAIIVLLSSNLKADSDDVKKEVVVPNLPAMTLPLSRAIEYNDMIFVSGQIGADPITGVIGKTVEEQTEQVLANLKQILEASGSSMDKVLKVNVFVKNMNDFNTVNQIYATKFTKPYPVRTFVEVARLPLDVLIEIEVIAHK